LLAQAAYVRRKALVLPEATGSRCGTTGKGPSLRLLVLGDSSAAGVGVEEQSQALLGQLLHRMRQTHCVDYHLIAQTGLTTAQCRQKLEAEGVGPYDLAVVALGVNDVTRLVRPQIWLDQQVGLHEVLRRDFGVRFICRSGLPPMGLFPLLPNPLRSVLGARATELDNRLQALVSGEAKSARVSLEFPLDAGNMAADGYHPSAQVYATWAERVMSVLPSSIL
jgi:lysophospholipase L1-like esterase